LVTEELIQKLEALYQSLLTKDPTPDEENFAKAQLIDILSSIKANAEMQAGVSAKSLVNQTNALKDLLLAWDPYGSAWFKEEKALVNGVSSLLASAKALKTQKAAEADSSAISALKEQIEGLASTFNAQIANLNNEIASIKKSVIALATAMKNKLASPPAPQEVVRPPMPVVEQRPVSLNAASAAESSISPKPVPVLGEDSKKVMAKPISIPKPIPIPLDEDSEPSVSSPKPFQNIPQQPIPIPKPGEKQASRPEQRPRPNQPQVVKPVPKPISVRESPGPIPIPLSGADFEEPIPLDEAEAETEEPQILETPKVSNKEKPKKSNRDQLFSLLSSSSVGSPELGVDASQELSSSASEDSSVSREASADPEMLYQELISLEGKRYSIERSIRDLKTDRENGVLNDAEYKDKISQLLNKLQTISKRIEEIRKKLD
jgi:predicted  nucleic acid-binding Zn-ribbon protein